MKKIFYFLVALATFTASAQVGIGVPTANIDASAQLEVASTNKGFLAPRMTETQKNAITSPAVGLLVYQTDATAGFYFYDGTTWKQGLGPQGATGAAGAAGVAGQTNTSLLYPSASIYADGAAPTDAPSTVTSTYGNFGWYFKKTGNSKVNWYIQPKSSSMKVSDLTGLYLELFNVAITSASDMPFITVYTKADASSPNAASWYKSKRSYLFSATPAANTKYLGFVNLGANSPNSYNNNLLNLAVENFLSRGDYAQTEDILMISINTNSVASACEFVANKLGVISGSGTQEFLFMPPSSIANLSSYATTLALNTETSRAQAAETTLTSSVNDLSNNVIQNYATNTSVTDLANEVMQNYATNTFVNNLANDVIQNYATNTSVNVLANEVMQNYATNTAVNNLSNNLTGTIQQLEGQVAQSTSDISALGSSVTDLSTAVSQIATMQAEIAVLKTQIASLLSSNEPPAVTVAIGDLYQGGKVAYILQAGDPGYDANVQHGFIVATATIGQKSTNYTPTLEAIGTGLANTNAIANADPNFDGAAQLVRAHNGGGYTDWFLPSLNEAKKIAPNCYTIFNFDTGREFIGSSMKEEYQNFPSDPWDPSPMPPMLVQKGSMMSSPNYQYAQDYYNIGNNWDVLPVRSF